MINIRGLKGFGVGVLLTVFSVLPTLISSQASADPTCVNQCRAPFQFNGQTAWGPSFFLSTKTSDGDIETSGLVNQPCKCIGWGSDVPVIDCPNPVVNAYYGGVPFTYVSCPFNVQKSQDEVKRLPACAAEFDRIVNKGGACR